jgi:hypothetical protein
LNLLRDQLVGGAKSVAALRAEITTAVAAVPAFASDVRVATTQATSQTDYQRMTADIDRRVAQSYQQENLHLAYAHNVAVRYGIDISGYEQERSGLESERDAARSKGDKLGERKADALIAQNTYNTLASETDSITDPADRKKHLEEMRDQQRIVEERRAALAAQIELEAKRTAAQRHLSPDETATYVAQFRKDQLATFDNRVAGLKGNDQSAAAHAELETALRSGVQTQATSTPQHKTVHPVAASLTPEAIAKTREIGARINAAKDTVPGSLDDSSLPPTGPSQIKLDTSPDAHKTVEVPPVQSNKDTSADAAVGF